MIFLSPDTQEIRDAIYPFAEMRQSYDLRVGILTIKQKWQLLLGQDVHTTPENTSIGKEVSTATMELPGNWFPTSAMAAKIKEGRIPDPDKILTHGMDICKNNAESIIADFLLLTQNRESAPIPGHVLTVNQSRIFIEEGAVLGHCTLNASEGPVYIGKKAEVMDGATIRGPFALCEGGRVKMGARIYEGTTIGPYSIAGGELKNTMIMAYSNKAHDGYLGDTVIGEWCNLGAGSTASNVSHSAGEVKIWSKAKQAFMAAGPKCGLLMGDFSRSAINTTFNTGTVVGIAANVFGSGLSPKLIPDFTWGMHGEVRYEFDKAIRDIGNWKKMKDKVLEAHEITALRAIFAQR